MTWGKFLTQATFAAILAMMAILPVTTYGCLKLQEAERMEEPGAGNGGDEKETAR